MNKNLTPHEAQGAKVAKKDVVFSKERDKSIDVLCNLYKYPIAQALRAGLAGQLKLTTDNSDEKKPFTDDSDKPKSPVFYCKTRHFRQFLKEEADAMRYNETEECATCHKEKPLYLFSVHNDSKLNTYMCSGCKKEYDPKHSAQKKGDAEHAKKDEFDESGDKDCRIYLSTDDFKGKSLRQDIFFNGQTVDWFEITIEDIIPINNGSVTAIGRGRDGKPANITIFECEIMQLFYQGLSLYWSQRTERVIRKTIVEIPKELFAPAGVHNYAVPYFSNTKK